MEPAFSYQGIRLKATIKGEEPIDFLAPDPDPHQFLVEADDFADCVFNNKEPKADGQEGLRDMKLMAEIYKSAGFHMGTS
jgi:predicted dehydrogenase